MLLSELFCIDFVSWKPLTVVALLIYRCSKMFLPFHLIMGTLKTIYRTTSLRELSLSYPYLFLSVQKERRGGSDFLIIRPHGSFFKITMCVI